MAGTGFSASGFPRVERSRGSELFLTDSGERTPCRFKQFLLSSETLWGSTTVEKAVLSTFFLVSALSYPKSTNTIKTSLPQSVSCSSPYRFPPLTSTTITRRAPSPGLQSTLGNTNEYKHPETRVGREEWPITRVQEQQLPPKDQPMILLNTTIDGKFPLNTTSSKF